MKIGLIIYGSLETLSGGYLYDHHLVDSLRESGDEVDIISLPWRNYAAHLTDNLRVKLPRGFDILIEDELCHPSLISANSSMHDCPVVSLVHHLRSSEDRSGWQNRVYEFIEAKYLRTLDGFIFNSMTTSEKVRSILRQDTPAVIANPPTDRFGNPQSEEAILERSNQKPIRLMFLGNLIARKGLHTLLEAVADYVDQKSYSSNSFNSIRPGTGVLRDPVDIHLDIVGSEDFDPRYARSMKLKVDQLGLTSFVEFHGAQSNHHLSELLKRTNILVVPSTFEGFGIAYLEGMCFGLPAIGTTSGAAQEIITNGLDGYLIEPGDSHSLVEKIDMLLRDRRLLIRMSLAARQRYLKQPAWEESATKIWRFLHSLAGIT